MWKDLCQSAVFVLLQGKALLPWQHRVQVRFCGSVWLNCLLSADTPHLSQSRVLAGRLPTQGEKLLKKKMSVLRRNRHSNTQLTMGQRMESEEVMFLANVCQDFLESSSRSSCSRHADRGGVCSGWRKYNWTVMSCISWVEKNVVFQWRSDVSLPKKKSFVDHVVFLHVPAFCKNYANYKKMCHYLQCSVTFNTKQQITYFEYKKSFPLQTS